MPRELPGLYWDHEKNRYFPLSSKPKPKVDVEPTRAPHHTRRAIDTDHSSDQGYPEAHKRHAHYRAVEQLKVSLRSVDKERAIQYADTHPLERHQKTD